MPKVIVTVAVDAPAVLDLTDRVLQATMPIPMSALLAEDWRAAMSAGREAAPQAFGRAAFAAKLSGLVVPSKPHRDGVNVLVFPQRLVKGDVLRVLEPDLLENIGKPA
jgi:RES domain-containing protein